MGKPIIRFKGYEDDWEQRKLEDTVEFLDTLRKPLEGAKRVRGPYPYYGASGIVDYVDEYLFDEELVLLSEDGANITDRNYPVCFLASGKYWVNNHAHVLKVKRGNENNFICNSLERKDYTKYNTGMAMPKLNQETCRNIPVMCPSFKEQNKIGNYFRRLDTLITLHQRKCDETKKLKKYMLQNMFPQDGEKIPRIRFDGFTDDWEQRKLGTVVEDYVEKTTVENQYPVLTSSQQMGIVLQDNYFSGDRVSQSGNIGYFVIPRGYFAYRSRSDNDVFVFNRNDCIDKGIISYFYPVFKPNGSDSDFLLRRLNFGLEKQLKIASEGTGQHVLSLKKFKNMTALFPEIEEQKKIGEYFAKLDTFITLHQRKCDELQKIKKFMLQNMFV